MPAASRGIGGWGVVSGASTPTSLWWLSDNPALVARRERFIAEPKNDQIISAASAWKFSTKVRLGQLPAAADLTADLVGHLEREGCEVLDISPDHAIRAGLLPSPQKDPFDRLLLAQAQADGFPVVSNDLLFDAYGVRRMGKKISLPPAPG